MSNISISKSPLEIDSDKIKRVYLNPIKTDSMESYIHEEESRYRPDGISKRLC